MKNSSPALRLARVNEESHTYTFIHKWNEPYLPLLSSRTASPHFGRHSFSVPLRVEGWVGRFCMKFSGKVGNRSMNKWLNFGGDPDLDAGIVFRIHHYWEIWKVVNIHKSAARTDSPDGGTGGKACLVGGMHCLSASSSYWYHWLWLAKFCSIYIRKMKSWVDHLLGAWTTFWVGSSWL